MSDLFSDRERGTPRARTKETIDGPTWEGLKALVDARINDGAFGYGFPVPCPDTREATGTDVSSFWGYVTAHVREVDPNGYQYFEAPPTHAILDFLELITNSVGKPFERHYHSGYQHRHLRYDVDEGRRQFATDVNRIFARNGIAFEMSSNGCIERSGPPVLRDLLQGALFRTGDGETDRLLTLACERITSRKIQDRVDALEKLWDAFERVKTLEPGTRKDKQVIGLLDSAARGTGAKFRERLECEARELTLIGNEFRIRHSEMSKEPISTSEQIDFFFYRLLVFLSYILRATGRAH
jgi:hypothetical protein